MANPEFIMENQMIYFIEVNKKIHKFYGLNSTMDFINTLKKGDEFIIYHVSSFGKGIKQDKIKKYKKLPVDEEYKKWYHNI